MGRAWILVVLGFLGTSSAWAVEVRDVDMKTIRTPTDVGEVIIRTEVHPGAKVFFVTFRGKKDERDGNGGGVRAQRFQHAITVQLRH